MDGEPLTPLIKPKVVEGGVLEIRAQGYVSQTKLTIELNMQSNYLPHAERHFCSKNVLLVENCNLGEYLFHFCIIAT